ncbi:hypothetical protein LEP1GSC018_3265 [Leptospira kirschneri str. 2008720114]|nr:hypothetical protein LEP1GSC018_3265 [Leptospira kirschneri str. 2008720114]
MKLKQNALSNFASMGARQIAFYIETKAKRFLRKRFRS